MSRLGLLLLLLAFSLFTRAQSIDVLHYEFQINLTDVSDSVEGRAIISFLQRGAGSDAELDLVSVRPDGKGMKVLSVESGKGKVLKFRQAGEKLLIQNIASAKGDTAVVFINYAGIPADGLIISKNKYGERTFFADNWPNRAHHWIPCNDRPDDKASFVFVVSAPQHYKVISNGVWIGEGPIGKPIKTTVWKEVIPQPTKVMVIGAARFAVKTYDEKPGGVPVSAWVYPQDSAKGVFDFALAPGILKYFAEYIGPYPYKKLANVQSKTIFGGMENAAAIFYAEDLIKGDRSSEDVVAHEIVHQWFGDMASEKSFAHLWLSEGFATYLTNIYFEQNYGRQKMEERMKEDRQVVLDFVRSSNKPVVDSSQNLMSLLNANSYQKGGWILHMLRNEVGDKSFQKIIQAYYQQYKGGNADSRDFEAVAEKVSGQELTWFFDQWLYQPGVPVLKMETKIQNNELFLSVKQKDKVYRFPLEIMIVMKDGETITERLNVSEKESEFRIPVKGTSVQFSIDPNVKLLYELKD
jgi:aminopeptidase N